MASITRSARRAPPGRSKFETARSIFASDGGIKRAPTRIRRGRRAYAPQLT